MITFEIEKLTETQWFNLVKTNTELTTDDFINNICEKCNLTILIQHGTDNDIGIYAIIKNIGLYGFIMSKNDFFKYSSKEIKLSLFNNVQTFIIDDSQNILTFMNYFDEFLKIHNKILTKKVKLVYYEDNLTELLNI